MDFLRLRSGTNMPAVGFGTWQATDAELESALDAALEAGYRHIDTAYVYENEQVIGRVLNKWLDSGKLKREDLFIVTKVPPVGNRPEGIEKYLTRSLKNLGLQFVDLYLVHTPFGFQERGDEIHPTAEDGSILSDPSTDHIAIWKAMEKQVECGRAKAIGLSNFNIKQIDRVLKAATIPPANLQVELHLYMQQQELVKYCKDHDIAVCAYSPLGSRGTAQLFKAIGVSKELPDLMNNPVVQQIAKRLGKSPAQVLLRYTLQRGVAVIPKSTNPERIKQNFQLHDFELSPQDVSSLAALDQGSSARVVDFSFFKGLSSHPEFPF